MILKHPVSVAIIAGIITFFACGHMNKNKKKKTKKTEKLNRKTLERKIIISTIVMLIVWFIMSCFNNDPKEQNDIKKISETIDKLIEDNSIQTGGKPAIPSKSYNILSTGINIPQEGIVIPDVLIDYV